jgi:hypothetical protein
MTATSTSCKTFGNKASKQLLTAASLLAALSATAMAGPDVIVGDLPDVSNYTSGGAIGGLRSYSVGTTSCNVGTTELSWISSTNQHPVISGNMYRLANGRFEQIGQSWLKHGFTALQGTVCDDCDGRWPNGNYLGVGCSDPYSSGLNGSQGGLGPKSEVNASTGYFPFPWINRGTSGTALAKRLIVSDADMGTANAQYFVASMYVAPDDAAAGNNNNNQSYRRINVNAANKDISLTGSTQRGSPAIFAWRDHGLGANQVDSSVQLSSVDVPNDGRFWIGSKATVLGGGLWRYEFAVQNLTSHQSGQSFSVPLPANAVVTNVGFKDVEYHSGEPFSGVDWTSNVTSNAITWSTQTFAQNANANALRFDTIYNFRFDCNIPPAGITTTLGLFRTGTVSSVTGGAVGPSADGQAHPLNDNCANAAGVGAGATTFSTVGAQTDGPDEPGACAINGYTQLGNDVWYRFTNGACSGNLTFSTCGSTFDTKLAIYSACPTGPGTALACNDDVGGCANNGSSITIPTTPGAAYYVRIGGYNAATGDGTLTITQPTCGPVAPENDNCGSAFFLPAETIILGTTTLSTNDGTASCGASASSPDVWYKYRPATSGTFTVTTCDSVAPTFDTVLSAYSGTCGALTQLACNDDVCGLRSTITVPNAVANQTYYIRVAGYNNQTGNFSIKVSGGGGVVPPFNDDCANRPGIPLGVTPFTTVGATTDGPAHAACNFFGNNNVTNDVWFNYPSQCDGQLTITTCGTAGFDTKIAVYRGNGCENFESRLAACSDDNCGNQTSVTVDVAEGEFITIRLGGYNGAVGSGSLLLSCTADPTCPADFNQDGGVDGADVEAFFAAWSDGSKTGDFNQDGGIDGSDVEAFFINWSNGC